MVSNSLGMDLEELLERLRQLKQEFGATAEYQRLRRALPADWPL
jgi:hypothetical protein